MQAGAGTELGVSGVLATCSSISCSMRPCVTVALAGPLTDGAEFAHELLLNTGSPLAERAEGARA